ncbi:hypothetical protein ACFLSQ_00240 [Bacteroidota bacterium]
MSKQYSLSEITDFIKSIDSTNKDAIEKGEKEFRKIIRDIIEKNKILLFSEDSSVRIDEKAIKLLDNLLEKLNHLIDVNEKILNKLDSNNSNVQTVEQVIDLKEKINISNSFVCIIGDEIHNSKIPDLYDLHNKYFEKQIEPNQSNTITIVNDIDLVESIDNNIIEYNFGYISNGVLHWTEGANQLAYSLHKIKYKLELDSISPNSVMKFIDNSEKIKYTCKKSTIIKRLEELQGNRADFGPKPFTDEASQIILNLLKSK